MNGAGWQVCSPRREYPVPDMPKDPGQWVKWLVNESADERRANLQIRVDGRANQRYALLFRDYLRSHPATAEAYGQFKRPVAELPFGNVGEYADLKDPVCDLVYLSRRSGRPVPAGRRPAKPDDGSAALPRSAMRVPGADPSTR